MNLELNVNTSNNFITICGENNTGKTNTLRAIDLFFNPDKYDRDYDTPNHKLRDSRGGSTFPSITVDFMMPNGDVYRITRAFEDYELKETQAEKITHNGKRKETEEVSELEAKKLIESIQFFFISTRAKLTTHIKP